MKKSTQTFYGVLRGAGQVMFQPGLACSLLFLAGILWGAWCSGRMAIFWGAAAGLLAAHLTGRMLRLKRTDGRDGLWGFNGILVGCAVMTFLRPGPVSWAVLLFGAAATVWVREAMNRVLASWRINSLTMPFVLTTWFLLAAAHMLRALHPDSLAAPALAVPLATQVDTGWLNLCIYTMKGIAQVFLIDNGITGLLFLLGLACSNGWSALWALVASALSLGLALLFGASGAAVAAGLYGYSPVLTGIALGSIFYPPSWRTALWALAGVVMTFFVQAAMNTALDPVGIPTLTAPFCLTTWLFLLPPLKSLFAPPHAGKPSHAPSAAAAAESRASDHSDWSRARKPHLPAATSRPPAAPEGKKRTHKGSETR